MELVPIVIAALKIVTVLAVVVLGISYISFKIKQKSMPQKDFASLQKNEVPQNFAQHVRKRLTSITREIHLPTPKKEVRKEAPKPMPQPKPKQQEFTSRSKERQPRIEVVKSSQPPIQKEKPIEKEVKKPSELNSLQGDILDKYADEDDQKLFTLKTNKKDQK